MPRYTVAQKTAALAHFWKDRAFRARVLKEAKAQGVIDKAINPDNLKLILEFIVKLLPIILQLFI